MFIFCFSRFFFLYFFFSCLTKNTVKDLALKYNNIRYYLDYLLKRFTFSIWLGLCGRVFEFSLTRLESLLWSWFTQNSRARMRFVMVWKIFLEFYVYYTANEKIFCVWDFFQFILCFFQLTLFVYKQNDLFRPYMVACNMEWIGMRKHQKTFGKTIYDIHVDSL